MAKISIKRRNESERADGCAPLYAVLNINREKIRVPVDLAVTVTEWDAQAERIKGRGQDAYDKNLIISNVKSKISDILVRARLTGEHLTKASFIALYRRPPEDGQFIKFARRHLDSTRDALQWETQRHHTAALKKLEEYRPDIHLQEITPEFLRAYAVHLRDDLGNSPGTIRKNMCVLRVYYYAAMRAGLVQRNPFDVYKVPRAEPIVVFLTIEEFNKLLALYSSCTLPDNEQDVLRFWLFMAFTGMHISDARTLQIEQIIGGEIHYTRQKTRTKVIMPLSGPAAKLVEFYKAGRRRGNLFVTLPTDQAFNRVIKRVCQRVAILKAVSAKAARHTFATLYYKLNGGDLGTLSKLLGHTSVNTTMIYAHILKENRVAGVSAFDGML
ncbi:MULTISPECIES: site-specific integrase [Muribaculaceae]|uniref:site-specific integrase n=1 Tax=Muribaculaceae TaxID=2005473 RepID=UPI0025A64446|nr:MULTISPECIES: site-specific integrase [Muribaculaceae]